LGDYVTSDSRLAALQTVSPQRASFQVPERYADQLKLGQQVSFRVAALPGREFTGKVDFVDPIVQLPGRTITVKAQVPNPRRELQAGMFIEARLATAIRPSAVVIPEDAVLPLQGSNIVWVVASGKATRRQVELGVRTRGFVEVKNGVENNEQVVVGGQERLAEGAPVQAKLVERRPAGAQEDVGTVDSGAAGQRGSGAATSGAEADGTGTQDSSGHPNRVAIAKFLAAPRPRCPLPHSEQAALRRRPESDQPVEPVLE
jgi:membrane fusion protein (multidrug efflux system)